MIHIFDRRGNVYRGRSVMSIVRRIYGRSAQLWPSGTIRGDSRSALVVGPPANRRYDTARPILGEVIYSSDAPMETTEFDCTPGDVRTMTCECGETITARSESEMTAAHMMHTTYDETHLEMMRDDYDY